ncbi:MAG: hypothetical protein QOE81_1813 [Verrucomicrobiota bacterium]
MTGRLLFVCVTLLVSVEVARGEGTYQRTRNGRTLVWNNHPKSGDEATWSGGRDREGYARGFGTLIWYTKETGSAKPALYARYWGRMIGGKFNGPVNVHSKKKPHYAIFDDGARTTHWSPGTAPSGASAKWRVVIAKRRINSEPEAPAAGPVSGRLEIEDGRSEQRESIQDLRSERWPLIDIDDSLRLLVFPPRTLRRR